MHSYRTTPLDTQQAPTSQKRDLCKYMHISIYLYVDTYTATHYWTLNGPQHLGHAMLRKYLHISIYLHVIRTQQLTTGHSTGTSILDTR